MSDACKCIDGHQIDCSTLLRYRFPPPPEVRIYRYWDNLKGFFRAAFLRVAIFVVAIYCSFVHFDYLKMRAKGRLSRWFFVPEWQILREDKDGHELGSAEQLYEPVEEHLRAAEALLDSRFGTGVRDRSQSPTLLGTPRESFAERRDITGEDITEALGVVLGTDSGTLAAFKKFILAREVNTTESTGTSSEPHVLSPAQMQQAGPSRVYAISSPPSRVPSQYSIHSDSSEPLDRDSMSITTTPKSREPELPPLSSQSSRKTRPFKASTHSQGETVWMTAFTYEDLSAPPEPAPEDEPGVLYIHRNLSNDATRVWLLGSGMQWDVVQPRAKIQHPIFGDRYLTIRADGTPSWVILASWKKWVNSQ